MRLRALDVFAAVGTLLFLIYTALSHYDRWVEARGRDTIAEFYLYAVLILLGICAMWLTFRRYPWRPTTLAMIAAGILFHFAGGLVVHDGARLYDVVVYGVRFDKLVHFVNAFMAARITAEILRFEGIFLGRMERLLIVLIILGLGGVWEMAEYVVLRAIPDAGVGFYHNTMQDQIANLCGAVCSVLVLPPRLARPATRDEDGVC